MYFSFSYRLLQILFVKQIQHIIFQKCCHKWNEAHKTTIYKKKTDELVYKLHSSIYPIKFIVVMYLPSTASYFNFGINLEADSDNIHNPWFNILIIMKVREIIPCKMRGSRMLDIMPCQLVHSHLCLWEAEYVHFQRHTVCSYTPQSWWQRH